MDPTYPVGLREFPQNYPDVPEIWIYSEKMSYSQGDVVTFYVHTNAKTYDLVIERDGGKTEKVYEKKGLKAMLSRCCAEIVAPMQGSSNCPKTM